MSLKELRDNYYPRLYSILKQDSLLKELTRQFSMIKKDTEEKPLVMILGEFKSGKSTFLNALLGMELLRSHVKPATAMSTIIKKGKEKKLYAFFKNGDHKEFDLSFLHSLSAEGDTAGELIRKQLDYLVLEIPHPLLESITLVDTPGLNAGIDEHTAATEGFMERADDVIFVFRYGNVGKSSEINAIERTHEYDLYPLGVINMIDLFEEDDEEFDVYIEYERKKLRPYVRDLMGVSAIDALEGKLESNAEKMEWSNFEELFKHLEDIGANETQKLTRSYQKLDRFLREMYDQLHSLLRADEFAKHLDILEGFLENEIGQLHIEKYQTMEIIHDKKKQFEKCELFKTPVVSINQLSHILHTSPVQNKYSVTQGIQQLNSSISAYKKELRSYDHTSEETLYTYQKYLGKGFFKIKHLFASKDTIKYVERSINKLVRQHQSVEDFREDVFNKQHNLQDSLVQSLPVMEQEMQENRNRIYEEALEMKSNYQEHVEFIHNQLVPSLSIIKKYKTVSILQEFLEDLKGYLIHVRESSDEKMRSSINGCLESMERILNLQVNAEITESYVKEFERVREEDIQIGFSPELTYTLKDRINVNQIPYEFKPDLLIYPRYNTRYFKPYTMLALITSLVYMLFWWNPSIIADTAKVKDQFMALLQNDVNQDEEMVSDPNVMGTVEVLAEQLNIRTGPSMENEAVGMAYRGEIFDVLEESDGWVRIGEDQWVSSSSEYVSYSLGENTQLEEEPIEDAEVENTLIEEEPIENTEVENDGTGINRYSYEELSDFISSFIYENYETGYAPVDPSNQMDGNARSDYQEYVTQAVCYKEGAQSFDVYIDPPWEKSSSSSTFIQATETFYDGPQSDNYVSKIQFINTYEVTEINGELKITGFSFDSKGVYGFNWCHEQFQ